MDPNRLHVNKKLADDWIPTRQSLLSRLRDWDDRESWEDFFNTYWKLIYNVARKSGLSEVEAEEVVQETVIHVSRQIPEFRYNPEKGAFKGWLLKATQWRIRDQFRKRRRFPSLEHAATVNEDGTGAHGESGPAQLPEVESTWDQFWQENLIEAAIDRVRQRADPREFQMFELSVQRDWPPLKVAQKLDVTRAHVYYARHKIAREIRKEIERLETPAPSKGLKP